MKYDQWSFMINASSNILLKKGVGIENVINIKMIKLEKHPVTA